MKWLNALRETRLVVGLLGMSIASIGALALVGYAIGHDSFYAWREGIGMAYNTAVAFLLTGIAITLISWTDKVWRH